MFMPDKNIFSKFPKYNPSPLNAIEYPHTNQIIDAKHAITRHCAKVDNVFFEPTRPA